MTGIRDKTARRLSCAWHGGGGSALYQLCSTGAISDATEVEISATFWKGAYSASLSLRALEDLAKLRAYARLHGPRGPVDGWATVWP